MRNFDKKWKRTEKILTKYKQKVRDKKWIVNILWARSVDFTP